MNPHPRHRHGGPAGAPGPGLASATPAARIAWWSVAVLAFGLSPSLGAVASTLAVVASLGLLPALARPGALPEVRARPTLVTFGLVFAALTLVFVVTARRWTDPLFAFNFIALPLAIPVYLVSRDLAPRRPLLALGWLCVAGSAVAAAVAFWQVGVAGDERAQAVALNPNAFGRIVLLVGFVALAGVFCEHRARRYLFYLGPLFGILAALLSESRGALLGVLAMAPLYLATLWLIGGERRHALILGATGTIAAVVVGAGAATGLVNLPGLSRIVESAVALAQGRPFDNSVLHRLDLYADGWRAFLDSPLIGHGWAGIFGDVRGGEVPPGFVEGRMRQLHNDVVNFAASAGVVGIACWMALLTAPLLGIRRRPAAPDAAAANYLLVLLPASYLVFGLTDNTFAYDVLSVAYPFGVAVALGVLAGAPAPADRPAG